MHACLLTLIKLTSAKGAYIVVEIINRDRWMTSTKISLRQPLLDTSSHSKLCHIIHCYAFIVKSCHNQECYEN
jgi:hypothetical protein